ncbi:MAG: Gfo/Idh/MocA family oxidoreductase [Chloroflexi bacterium]|nr:Gfo/Idh/MocA family oxidoreductase [Chloroflexota bacterium]
MPNDIRWGILSTANIARVRVVPAIVKSKNGIVHAVASRSQEKALAFAEELDIPVAYGSYEDLLADPDIDAIYIGLPNSMHAEWAIKCAEAGKATLCEKPLASNAPEAQTMVDAFSERDLLFAEAFMWRFHPQSERVRQMIQDGAIGEPHAMRSTFSFPLRNDDNIRLQGDLAGGALMDVGCYCVNSMRFMTGEEPEQVAALAHVWLERDVDEWLSAVLQFPRGLIGHFDCSLRTFREHSYEIRGSEGRILVPEAFVSPIGGETTIRHWRSDAVTEITIPGADHYQLMAEDFADALIDSRPPRFLAQDAVQNMQVIDRLYEAAGMKPRGR